MPSEFAPAWKTFSEWNVHNFFLHELFFLQKVKKVSYPKSTDIL